MNPENVRDLSNFELWEYNDERLAEQTRLKCQPGKTPAQELRLVELAADLKATPPTPRYVMDVGTVNKRKPERVYRINGL